MSKPTATYVLSADDIRAGDQVFIAPRAGIHGHGCWWAMVVSTMPALVNGAVYLRVVPVDDIETAPRRRRSSTHGSPACSSGECHDYSDRAGLDVFTGIGLRSRHVLRASAAIARSGGAGLGYGVAAGEPVGAADLGLALAALVVRGLRQYRRDRARLAVRVDIVGRGRGDTAKEPPSPLTMTDYEADGEGEEQREDPTGGERNGHDMTRVSNPASRT
ncbi:hypothetical protein Athai_49670 [Actinocatenispora thailandica]|uniref:Uncharacterized protein n=1 Tax=Actinocatenispora thailandica TaxID=227318 RepID=A0A7R7DTC7_9ACTN|nr:hypothetical protein Athai_49670 [Actinocatenispora thailandica]